MAGRRRFFRDRGRRGLLVTADRENWSAACRGRGFFPRHTQPIHPSTTMISLSRFFKNPFLDPSISHAELQAFAEDHLAKMTAANEGGIYDGLVTDTGTAYENHFGELTSVSLRAALQKAATQTMRLRWEELVKWMTTKGEARVKDRADKPSAVYTEFFPGGMGEYHQSTVADGQTLARRIKESAATNAALLGADFQTKVAALAEGYLSARSAQLEKKGSRTDTGGSRDEAKAALQDQLFENLLVIAGRVKDPEKCALYFDQSLLEDAQAAAQPAVPAVG